MRAHEFTPHDRVDYVIYVNKKPATVYDTRAQAMIDLDDVKKKHPGDSIVIKRRVKSVRYHDEPTTEDVSSTPGGVGGSTKMFLEKRDSEAQPRVRRYENSRGERRWEVLDWQGVRHGPEFTHSRRAHEYLERNRHRLEYREELDESNPKWQLHQTPRQRAGIKNWREIDRAHRQVNVKNPEDPLRTATLKYYGTEVTRTLTRDETEAVWNFIKEFNRDPKNQPRQGDLYDALSTDRGIEQILLMTRSRVTEDGVPPTVWMIEYVPNEEKRKDAPYRQTRRLFYRNHDDAQVAVTKLRNKLADVLGAGAIQISARGVPVDRIK